jgi:rRNA methylases
MFDISKHNIIRSKSNATIVSLAKIGSDKKYRDNDKMYAAEGVKLFCEAVRFGADVRKVLICEDFAVNINGVPANENAARALSEAMAAGAEIIVASSDVFMKVTGEMSPQGIIAYIGYDGARHKKIPSSAAADGAFADDGELVMMLESVRDPSNLGAIMRCACALGYGSLILTDNCADIYNPKTLRASMGAVFKLKTFAFESSSHVAESVKKSGRRLIAARLDDTAHEADRGFFKRSDCVVIGNEGHGISRELAAMCNTSVYIPISADTESLNAASASSIIMWEQSRSSL